MQTREFKSGQSRINCAVIIPALNPGPNLPAFVQALLDRGIPQVIVVNDGSDRFHAEVFSEIEQSANCAVLVHQENQGKGQALKTAFSYFLENFAHLDGVVTADADGQHAVEDIYKIGQQLSAEQDKLILGVRNFQKEGVPKRSLFGNTLTSRLFQLLYGVYLRDTQTGLRGIPTGELSWMLDLPGQRYDYEINMLIEARKRGVPFATTPIQTLYFDNNAGSHYNTIADSARIFVSLLAGRLKEICSAVTSVLVDLFGFYLLNEIFADLSQPLRLFFSTFLARGISSLYSFILNRRLIFIYTGRMAGSHSQYFKASFFLTFASFCLVWLASALWGSSEILWKFLVDLVLALITCSYFRAALFCGSLFRAQF